jgi:hypothetical protein
MTINNDIEITEAPPAKVLMKATTIPEMINVIISTTESTVD